MLSLDETCCISLLVLHILIRYKMLCIVLLHFVLVPAYVLTIVITDFRLSLSLYAHCFRPTSGIIRKLEFCFLSYFDKTKRNIKRNKSFFFNLYFFTKKIVFFYFLRSAFCCGSLDQPLVPV